MVTRYVYINSFLTKILANGGTVDNAKQIEDFPDYSIEPDGTVYSLVNGRIRRPSMTREGAVKITLYHEGMP